MLEIGDRAVDFTLYSQDKQEIALSDFMGKWVVLYFYPKDNTSGCSVEALDFTSLKEKFEKKGTVILGVSPDSVKSHQNFIKKKELGITLLSDPEHKVLDDYGAWQLKKNYGREYFGVVRTTYLIDDNGKIVYVWKKVKAKGHGEAVLNKLSDLIN